MKFEFNESHAFCICTQSEMHTRWKRMQNRLAQFGDIKVQCWEASSAHTLTSRFAQQTFNPGERGCAQTHFNIWKHIVKNKLPYALILESGAMFRKDWQEKLALLNLGEAKDNIKDQDWDSIVLNASEEALPIETWLPAKDQFLTGGYSLSWQGAKWLVDTFSQELWTSDWMSSRLQLRGKSYTLSPGSSFKRDSIRRCVLRGG
jgi:GR25 family glycosyltransferase involved in LPS biosynthesis